MRALIVVAAAVLAGISPCAAQDDAQEPRRDSTLVHLDTAAVAGRAVWSGRLEVRAFGGDEDVVYTGLGLSYGLGNGWVAIARGMLAERKDFALPGGGAIRHGGNDLEILAKYQSVRYPRLAGLVGVAFADTAAQSDTFLTLGATASAELGERATAYLNPRAVFIEDNTLVGIGLGVRARLTAHLDLVGDWTPLVAGDNTRDTTTGSTRRRDVFGVAVRYTAPDGRYALDLGFANGTGHTTGAALTPGLGDSGAFYVALSARW